MQVTTDQSGSPNAAGLHCTVFPAIHCLAPGHRV
jgi:hypothetical protein